MELTWRGRFLGVLVWMVLLSVAAPGQSPAVATKEYIHLGGRLIAIESTGSGCATATPVTASVAIGGGVPALPSNARFRPAPPDPFPSPPPLYPWE